MNLIESAADLSGYLFRIVDNGAATLDRFTVIFSDGDYLALSETGAGFSQWGEGIDVNGVAERIEAGEETDVSWRDLAPELQRHILARVNEAWRDFVASEAAAPDRESAEPCEGLYSDGGKGIYRTAAGFMVRQEGGPDDSGPFDTFREAVLATLPEPDSLAGSEFHPPVDPLAEGESH